MNNKLIFQFGPTKDACYHKSEQEAIGTWYNWPLQKRRKRGQDLCVATCEDVVWRVDKSDINASRVDHHIENATDKLCFWLFKKDTWDIQSFRDPYTLQVAIGPDDSFFARDARGYSADKLPEELEGTIRRRLIFTRGLANGLPMLVALGLKENYVVAFKDGTLQWQLSSYPELDKLLTEMKSAREVPEFIALSCSSAGKYFMSTAKTAHFRVDKSIHDLTWSFVAKNKSIKPATPPSLPVRSLPSPIAAASPSNDSNEAYKLKIASLETIISETMPRALTELDDRNKEIVALQNKIQLQEEALESQEIRIKDLNDRATKQETVIAHWKFKAEENEQEAESARAELARQRENDNNDVATIEYWKSKAEENEEEANEARRELAQERESRGSNRWESISLAPIGFGLLPEPVQERPRSSLGFSPSAATFAQAQQVAQTLRTANAQANRDFVARQQLQAAQFQQQAAYTNQMNILTMRGATNFNMAAAPIW